MTLLVILGEYYYEFEDETTFKYYEVKESARDLNGIMITIDAETGLVHAIEVSYEPDEL